MLLMLLMLFSQRQAQPAVRVNRGMTLPLGLLPYVHALLTSATIDRSASFVGQEKGSFWYIIHWAIWARVTHQHDIANIPETQASRPVADSTRSSHVHPAAERCTAEQCNPIQHSRGRATSCEGQISYDRKTDQCRQCYEEPSCSAPCSDSWQYSQ
jgi:hypothetical protein